MTALGENWVDPLGPGSNHSDTDISWVFGKQQPSSFFDSRTNKPIKLDEFAADPNAEFSVIRSSEERKAKKPRDRAAAQQGFFRALGDKFRQRYASKARERRIIAVTAAIENQCSKLRAEISRIKGETASKQRQLAERNAETERLRSETAAMTKELSALTKQKESIQAEIQSIVRPQRMVALLESYVQYKLGIDPASITLESTAAALLVSRGEKTTKEAIAKEVTALRSEIAKTK